MNDAVRTIEQIRNEVRAQFLLLDLKIAILEAQWRRSGR